MQFRQGSARVDSLFREWYCVSQMIGFSGGYEGGGGIE
jgi:hypothetical protein